MPETCLSEHLQCGACHPPVDVDNAAILGADASLEHLLKLNGNALAIDFPAQQMGEPYG